MDATNLKNQYDILVCNVENLIRKHINVSGFKPKDYNYPAIELNSRYTHYVAIMNVSGDLVFLDEGGYQYNLENVTLETLIEILEEYEN